MHAVYKGHTDTVKVLIDKGADVDVRTGDIAKTTALIIAVLQGHTETVKALIAKGVNVDAKGAEGWTAENMQFIKAIKKW